MKPILTTALVLALGAAALPAFAHPSGAMFDHSRSKVITGLVKEFNWANPHASFAVDVPQANGQTEVWAIEMNSPNNLIHDGWKRSTLKVGDKVTVGIYPLRDGRPGGTYVNITLADGSKLGAEPTAGEK